MGGGVGRESLTLQEPLTLTKKEMEPYVTNVTADAHKKVKIDLIGDRLDHIT
jgi:hypothetical protein